MTRAISYAQLIRHIFCGLDEQDEACMLRKLVDSFPTTPKGLFPNLQSLNFDIREDTSTALVDALLTLSITRVHAQWHRLLREEATSLHRQQETILQAICARSPHIIDLAIRRDELDPKNMTSLQPFIPCLAGMTNLSLDPGPEELDSDFTRAVLALPRLLHLHVSQKTSLVDHAWAFTLKSDGRGLRHLSHLYMQHDCIQLPQTLSRFCDIACIQSIESLTLRVLPPYDPRGPWYQAMPQKEEWERIWLSIGTILGEKYATCLRSLHLSFLTWNTNNLVSVMKPFETLSGLKSYEFSVDVGYIPDMDLEHTQLASRLWPCLMHFSVDARPRGHYGMEHIREFVRPMANLTSIRIIHFDLVRPRSASEGVKTHCTPLPLIEKIQLGGEMLGHEKKIIRFNSSDSSRGPFVTRASVIDFLLTCFPNVQSMQLGGMNQFQIQEVISGIRRIRAELSWDAFEGGPAADSQMLKVFVAREPGSDALRACVVRTTVSRMAILISWCFKLLDDKELWSIDDTKENVRIFPSGRM
jgi:hypothetical protein